MTNNYNASLFSDKNSDFYKLNDLVLKEVSESGRCNKCKYFNFGAKKCNKRTEDGKLVRKDYSPIIYTEPTDKGNFIHVLKPSDCKDFRTRTANRKDSDS